MKITIVKYICLAAHIAAIVKFMLTKDIDYCIIAIGFLIMTTVFTAWDDVRKLILNQNGHKK